MKGQHLAIGLLVALFVAVGAVFWIGATGQGRASELGQAQAASAFRARQNPSGSPKLVRRDEEAETVTTAPIDRGARDEARKRILAAWASAGGELAEIATHGQKLPPVPSSPANRIAPDYAGRMFRDALFPHARRCYEELARRQPGARGRIELTVTILGDDSVGGVVEDIRIEGDAESALRDATMSSCIEGALLGLTLPPPSDDGWGTFTYPIEFTPNDDRR